MGDNTALKQIAKGAGIVLTGLIISKLFGFAVRIVVARVGADQYGLFSIALAVFGILFSFSMLGMNEGVVRFVSFYKGKKDYNRVKGVITSASRIALSLSIISSLFLYIFSNWIAVTFFHNLEISILLKILAFAIPFDILRNIFLSAIKGFQKVRYEVYAKSIAENVVKVLLSLLALYLGFGIIGVTFAYLISLILSFVLSFYFLENKVFSIIKTKIVSITCYKKIIFYSFPLLLTSFVYLIIQWTDTIMLGYFRTPSEVGIYNVALPTAFLLFLFPSSIRTLFFPILNELYAQNKQKLFKSVYRIVVKWIVIVDSILFVFLVIFSTAIIKFLFGDSYIADKINFFGLNFAVSSLALVILATGMILPEFLVPSKDVLLTLNRTKLIFINTIIGSFANIGLNYVLIPLYGLIGAAIATAVAYFIINSFIFIESYIFTKINPFKLNSLKVLAISLSIFIILYFLKAYAILNIFYVISLSLFFLIIYIILLLITKSFEKEDLEILESAERRLGKNLSVSKFLRRFV